MVVKTYPDASLVLNSYLINDGDCRESVVSTTKLGELAVVSLKKPLHGGLDLEPEPAVPRAPPLVLVSPSPRDGARLVGDHRCVAPSRPTAAPLRW